MAKRDREPIFKYEQTTISTDDDDFWETSVPGDIEKFENAAKQHLISKGKTPDFRGTEAESEPGTADHDAWGVLVCAVTTRYQIEKNNAKDSVYNAMRLMENYRLMLFREHVEEKVQHGMKFSKSKRGLSALMRLVSEIMTIDKNGMSNSHILDTLRAFASDGHPVIQEIEDDAGEIFIHWSDGKGRGKRTKWKTVMNSLSELRKKIASR